MSVKTPDELRKAWQAFFASKGHVAYPSASLVPANDPTLLFTGAGMNQFKDMFLGKGTHSFKRASTVQKVLRAGDLENVGVTLRHLTFFEMLGNFSFDDYFKEEAIAWAWEFATDVLRYPAERIAVTVYRDDDESVGFWRRHGVPADRIHRFSAKANFWPQNAPEDGPDGPCGPCTEMYYDFGAGTEKGDAGKDDLDSGRYLEFWNLVFPGYDRQGKNNLRPLGRRNVDTGAGFERNLAILGGHNNPFHTPVLLPIVMRAAEIAGTKYDAASPEAARLRRIADHARAATFCVADGVKPSNEGRGYVLRRLLRRAIRDGVLLGIDEPFLAALVPSVVAAMKDGYPVLVDGEKAIETVLKGEEEQFRSTYARGLRYLEEELRGVSGKVVPGAIAFRLHDTYGFPVDLAQQILGERGMTVDMAGYERELEAQRDRARAASKMAGDVFATGPLGEIKARGGKPTVFRGYWDGEAGGYEASATIVGVVVGDHAVPEAKAGDDVTIVLDKTPFYAEGGGQVGDRGEISVSGGTGRVAVSDTKGREGFHLHVGKVVSGVVRAGDRVTAAVDRAARDATRRNHTATHLLHEALKRVLGPHVQQQGSLVAPDRLRFDFTHPKALSDDEVRRIEDLVNGWVLENPDVETRQMKTDEAKASGAVALFGENYGDVVRVVGVPSGGPGAAAATAYVSRELCGGTHVRRTGDIGSFRVVSEGSVSAGVRRIEGVTGTGAVAAATADRDRLKALAAMLKAPFDQIEARVSALEEEARTLRKAAEKAAGEAGARLARDLAAKAETVGGMKVLVAEAKGVDAKGLRGLWEAVAREGVHVAVLLGEDQNKVPLVAGAAPEAVKKGVRAGDLLKLANESLGGGGGGRPDFAQGQGLSRAKIGDAIASVSGRVRALLGG